MALCRPGGLEGHLLLGHKARATTRSDRLFSRLRKHVEATARA